ncbi:putative aldo-keto reductase family 1 member C8 isoform X1 [Pongo pygmaeus]|uniref:putative aldo-keto reductase family 1 member C8 isoform X1 n=2 Tax=Pongo pygmaeus TaxID=9600 RepID=UPI0023E186AB|nr:putative aldo-keto reductase family 1 member C8 [Pongo abelii]XP_054293072.1 putative aldo-keto reductase family 1 member C8 isoform X1 [Pongo pygmaeus]
MMMDLKQGHSVRLNDGHFMPVLGFGTYAPEHTPKSQAAKATKVAIDVGFRHIDSAYLYQNEEEVGQAIWEKIADGTVMREEIFYTTKLWATFLRPELVRPALERSLKKLGLDYVDLFIIHVPFAMKPGEELLPKDASGEIILETVDLCDTWEALEKCKEEGLTKSIGVSNFNHKLLELILNKPGLKYKPTCNQVECHPYLNQSKLLEFCKSKDIVLVAYSALGSQRDPQWVDPDCPHLLEEPILKSIAKKHSRSPGQVALRYQLQRGVVVLAKSFSQERIKENFQIFDFELTPEDMKAIDGLNRNLRYDKLQFAANHPYFPFSEEY